MATKTQTAKISYYRNDATGELAPPHRLGQTEDGRLLYQAVEGWTPANEDGTTANVECDDDGNWIPATETKSNQIRASYVVTEDDTILVQCPDPTSRWGFYLADDDQTWDGGFGVASEWELIADDDPRITPETRERLGWILDEHR